MEPGQLVLTFVSALLLAGVGALALLRPHAVQNLAISATRGTRDTPIARRIWYDWVRSEYYIGVTRLLGGAALLIAVLLVGITLLRVR